MKILMISIDSYKYSLSKDGKKILDECDKYIDAMRLNCNRTPGQLCLTHRHYKALQSAINGFTKRQGTKPDPPELSNCLYRDIGFAVQ